jgi:hypothetical protein
MVSSGVSNVNKVYRQVSIFSDTIDSHFDQLGPPLMVPTVGQFSSYSVADDYYIYILRPETNWLGIY